MRCFLLLSAAAMVMSLVSGTESHVAYIVSKSFLEESAEKLFLSAFIQEIDELQMADLSIKQKTEHQRLSALMQNVKLSSLDFSKSNVKVDFNSPGKDFEEC